jgi:hypothetical protein
VVARGASWIGLRSSPTATANGSGMPPPLTPSEISRGLTNADLHLRQHYDEALEWDADKEESRVFRRTVSTGQDKLHPLGASICSSLPF